ncbi:MAG: hypothetical protein V4675_01990 [Verrucomicrobiota bacterium]
MKNDERILELPQPIIDRLREVIARVRRLQWIKGSLLTLAAAVGAVLGVMAIDAAFSLEALPVRIALSSAALLFTAWVAWTWWIRPLSRRISLTAVARWVETRHPELHERISTAVELLGAGHDAQDQGSRELLQAVVQDAVADVGRMDPAQDLSNRRTRPAKWLAGSAVAALLALCAIWPGQIPRLLARAVAPMADVGNAWADRLRVITQSQVVAIGDPLSIEVALSGKQERVELHLTGPDGKPVVEMLQPDGSVAVGPGESGYALRLPAVEQGFTAKVLAGKAVSAAFTITAVPRPESGDWTVTYDYPDYTGLPDEVKAKASGEIFALAGTKVTVQTLLNRPVAKASVRIGEADVPDVKLSQDPAAPAVEWSAVLTPGLDAQWSLQLEDGDGIANRPVDLPIRSLADLPPVITLDTPAEDRLELRPTEKVALTYSVKEDIGLSAVQIRIRPQDKPEYLLPPQALPDKLADSVDTWQGTAVLDLAKVLVPDGQEIRVCLMAADRVPPELQGPQRSWSREIVIRLNRWSRPQVEKNFEAQHEELRRKMDEVKRELQHAKGRMNDKPDRLKQDDKLSENTLKDIEASASHMQEAESLLKELTERMKETAYARQTPALEEIAQQMVQPAQADARDIPLTDQKEARAELAKNARDLLENALKKIEQEQQQMEQDRKAVQQLAKLSDIAEQQQRLAQEAAAAASPPVPGATQPAANPPPGTAPDPSAPTPSDAQANQPPPGTTASAEVPPPAPLSPTDEEQRQWLEEQRRVAQRAKELMEQNQNTNPTATQEQMKQAGAQAAALAAEAEALANQEKQLASEMAAAATPESQQQTAAAQQQLADQTAKLQEKTKGFHEQATQQIDQSTGTQESAYQAQAQLKEATDQAKQSGKELTAAAQAKPAAPPEAASPAPETSSSPDQAAAAASEKNPSDGATPPTGQESAATSSPAQAGVGPSAPPEAAAGSENQPSPDNPAPAPAGQQAAQASGEALAQAAQSLKSLQQELNSLAGMMADHNNALNEGAQQAGTASDQAAKSQNEGGKAPSMQQGAQAAQQAADQLAMAANTAMQAMSIPASAKSSQSSAASKGKGKTQDGQPKPAEPGQEGKDGLQMDTASSLLPEELAKLGLTQDDWMKLKSALNGVDATRTEQIPAEYRELVKAYFGALAKGSPAK